MEYKHVDRRRTKTIALRESLMCKQAAYHVQVASCRCVPSQIWQRKKFADISQPCRAEKQLACLHLAVGGGRVKG